MYKKLFNGKFLILKRLEADGTYTQVASTAQPGQDGVAYLDSIEKEDRKMRAKPVDANGDYVPEHEESST
jgi:hypothetical protein